MKATTCLLLIITYLFQVNSNNLIDLTWPFNNVTISWGDGQKYEVTKETIIDKPDGNWYAAKEFALAEHCGTHLDAPYHFAKNGWKVDEIPLSRLIVECVKIDLSEKTAKLGHTSRLLPEDLIEWERRHGPIPPNSVILAYFNWGQFYNDREKYLGANNSASYKFPALSPEAAQWIANTNKVVGVGLDTPSVDPGGTTTKMVHKTLAENQIYGLENVKIPKDYPEKGCHLYVMPMLLAGGTGAPVRIISYLNGN
ncbi:hypothetical protein PPYR_04466 [Photinus pyralis]|uniref:Cyclase n=1 Tax=Photinus pyralis TaxID=7054 RepID=A0A5N4AYP3_PHOPY|nr:uncharacterized protein LOC116164415 [Photinus pyralis]XP_031334457.1 uncharacterized protein LOC116164415 [Photinus pyralis]KAB0802280.1 hypothetical protein PPYR_04466 [Photinus pyralis]